MKTPEYITVQDLYAYAKVNKLLDARIRICDGMAVSYYPDPGALSIGRFEIIIDISANQPVEFDELDQWAQRQYDADRARHIHQMERDAQAAQRREYLRSRQAKINANADPDRPARPMITPDTDPDELPWEIYGYGPYRRRK